MKNATNLDMWIEACKVLGYVNVETAQEVALVINKNESFVYKNPPSLNLCKH